MQDVSTHNASAAIRDRCHGFIWPVALSVLPVLMLRPWDLPFSAMDFSGTFPAMAGSVSLADAFSGLTEMVRLVGRHHPLWTFWLAASWWVLGESAVLWHLAHVGLFAALVVVVYRQLQRAGASIAGVTAGITCAVLSGAVFSALTFPEVAEPLGLLFVIVALSLAHRLLRAPGSVWCMAGVVLAATAAVLVKETFVIAIPAVMMAAGFSLRRASIPPGVARRNLAGLTLALAIAIGGFAVAPALRNAAAAPAGASGALYDPRGVTVDRIRNVSAGMFLPVTRNPMFPANAAFLLLAAIAVGGGLANGPQSRERLIQLGTLATLPAFGTLMYLPWPAFPGYYGLLGMPLQAAIVALAVDLARGKRGWFRAATFALVLVLAGYGVLIGLNRSEVARAEGRLEDRLVHFVRDASVNGITLISDEARTDYARSIGAYATLGQPDQAARVVHLDCRYSGPACSAVRERGTLLIFPDSSCADACDRPGSRQITECAATIDWKSLKRTTNCQSATLIDLPAGGTE